MVSFQVALYRNAASFCRDFYGEDSEGESGTFCEEGKSGGFRCFTGMIGLRRRGQDGDGDITGYRRAFSVPGGRCTIQEKHVGGGIGVSTHGHGIPFCFTVIPMRQERGAWLVGKEGAALIEGILLLR